MQSTSSYKHFVTLIFFSLSLLSSFAQKPCAFKSGTVDYLSELNCPGDFDAVQSLPLKSSYADVQSIKVVYDLSGNTIYYTDSKRYRFHFDFCSTFLNAYSSLEEFNRIEYSDSRQRQFAICNLNYYTESKIYCLEFFPDDRIRAADAIEVFNKIQQTTFFGDKLKVLDNSWHTQEWAQNKSLPLISSDVLYGGQTYQAMKNGEAYGYLRFFEDDAIMQKKLGAHDIAVLANLPNNLPLCAATITAVFQTPLCHINILSQNRNTPNCTIKNAFAAKELLKYKNQLVRINVYRDTISLTPATEKDAQAAWNKKAAKKLIKLSCDSTYKQLADIKDLGVKSIKIFGGKAANMGELTRVRINKQSIPLPDKAFAIPFFFYLQHINNNHIKSLITALINDKEIINNKPALAAKLKQIRDSIENSPLSSELQAMVIAKIGGARNLNFRFRSSTNAEDVPGFNGAGLYDSKTGSVTNIKKPIDKAIKEVWASLWKLRAFEERMFFNIDQQNLAMGILVNKAFGTEEANGVAVTKNLYRNDYPAFTVNVQKGEESIVQPDDNIRAEQFLIHFSNLITGLDNSMAVDYICHSSLQPGSPLMTEAEVRELAGYLMAIKRHFWKVYPNTKKDTFNNFGVDVEFKLDSKTRKIFIKQARIY